MILENQEEINKIARLTIHNRHQAFDFFIEYRHNIILLENDTIMFSLTNPWPVIIPENLKKHFNDIISCWEKGSKEYAYNRAKEIHNINLKEYLKEKTKL